MLLNSPEALENTFFLRLHLCPLHDQSKIVSIILSLFLLFSVQCSMYFNHLRVSPFSALETSQDDDIKNHDQGQQGKL